MKWTCLCGNDSSRCCVRKLDRPNRVGRGGMGKKRKLEVLDPDAEKTLYTSFVSAANSVSQLYTQAVQQQRKSSAAASRQTLERIAHFLMREYGAQDTIPKAALLHFLHQEYEGIEGCENLPHQFPVPLFPPVGQQGSNPEGVQDGAASGSAGQQHGRSSPGNGMHSPTCRRPGAAMQHAAAMEMMEPSDSEEATAHPQQQGFGFNF